jgi:hypothetical protein
MEGDLEGDSMFGIKRAGWKALGGSGVKGMRQVI